MTFEDNSTATVVIALTDRPMIELVNYCLNFGTVHFFIEIISKRIALPQAGVGQICMC